MKYISLLAAGLAAAMLTLTGCGERHDAGELLDQAAKHLSAGQYAKALSAADSAVRCAPERYDALLMRAMVQERMGRTELALQSALAAEKLAPASFAVQYMLGRLYAADPRTAQEALNQLSKALALRPGDRNVLILQANFCRIPSMRLLKQLGRDTALASGATYCNELGVSELLSGQIRQGGSHLNLAVSRAPHNPVFRLNYARYLDFYAGQPAAALTHYQTYLGLTQNLAGHAADRKWTAGRIAEIRGRRSR